MTKENLPIIFAYFGIGINIVTAFMLYRWAKTLREISDLLKQRSVLIDLREHLVPQLKKDMH